MDQIAKEVLAALGGSENVLTNTVCMTRLRVTLRDPQIVDYDALNNVRNVLGTATRGGNGLEVVFGPRVIDGIYHAFLRLTGIEAGTDALFPMSRQESNFRVQINSTPRTPTVDQREWDSDHLDQGDIETLKELFADEQERSTADIVPKPVAQAKDPCNLLVINGPNVNMIGLGLATNAEVEDFSVILELCKETAQSEGFARCVCLQSNHEGDLVDWVQDAWGNYGAIVINPTSYAATSITLREAIRNVGIPTIRVNLTDDEMPSCLDDVCAEHITNNGIASYALAIRELADLCMA